MEISENMILDDRYCVIRPLGEGGMGAAYLVEDQRLGRRCVAKVSMFYDTAHSEQFEQEARMLAALSHPNLPEVYDYFFDRNRPYVIMQYIDGMALDQLAKGRSAPFGVAQVLSWADHLLDALSYLHSQKPPIIHRDVKPSNVCITPDGKAVLLDFGIARCLDRTSTRTVGQAQSLYYSPIEQYSAGVVGSYRTLRTYLEELEVAGIHTGPYSDVYSLGATLYFALTLCHPPDACLRRIGEEPRPIREFNPDVPDFLVQALDRALAVDPRERCQTAAELRQLLAGPLKGKNDEMYTAEIGRGNPGCFLFLIDQSYSMNDSIGGAEAGGSKAIVLADAINRLLQTIVGRCTKNDGVRRYFQVGVIGYGATVRPALGGDLAGRDLVWIDEIAHCARLEQRFRKEYDGVGGLVEVPFNLPIWFDPVANGGTPMCQALWQAHTILQAWVANHPQSFPPIVINITDGESTDGDPFPASKAIRELATGDGNVLLLNLHLSSRQDLPIRFPASEDELPDDEYARLLFRMSSILPDGMRAMAREKHFGLSDAARGFVFNARLEEIIEFLVIGTQPANMLR